MSYFLCLATPQEAVLKLRTMFDQAIYLTDVSGLPIGEATRGKNISWSAHLLQIGSSSASLIGKGSTRKTHNSDRSELLVLGIQSLIADQNCSSLSFLAHWMQGLIATERIVVKHEEQIGLENMAHSLLYIQEDVRYTIFK